MGSLGIPQVPTFALGDLLSRKHEQSFHECLREIGAFFVTGVDIDHTTPRHSVQNFFKNATEEEKEAMSLPDSKLRRGFTALGSESTSRITSTGDYVDYSMCYSMGVGSNLFPDVEFERSWNVHFDELCEVAQQIAGCLLLNRSTAYDPVYRFRNYPEVPLDRVAETEPLRMAPHYDISVITLIHQTPCVNGFESLQCLVNDQWVPLSAKRGLLVLCGAVATIMSDGHIKAPLHHVAAPGKTHRVGSARTSSVFFLRPDADFEFDVGKAREYGIDVTIPQKRATFGEWMGGNYKDLRNEG